MAIFQSDYHSLLPWKFVPIRHSIVANYHAAQEIRYQTRKSQFIKAHFKYYFSTSQTHILRELTLRKTESVSLLSHISHTTVHPTFHNFIIPPTHISTNSLLRSFLLPLPTSSLYSPVLPTTNNSCTHDTQHCATVTELKALFLSDVTVIWYRSDNCKL